MSASGASAREAGVDGRASGGREIRENGLQGLSGAIHRLARGIRRYGITGSLRRAATAMGRGMARGIYLQESHLWYRLDLTQGRPEITLQDGLELIRAGADDLSLLDQLPTVGLYEAQRRLASGAGLWIVREGGKALFSCWIFRDRMPVDAARGGWLILPPGTVGLEDSITSPLSRGRGIAPAAWSEIASALRRERVGAILTKVEERNTPTRRALEKIGFRTVASMRRVRVLARTQVGLRPLGVGEASAFLATHLAR